MRSNRSTRIQTAFALTMTTGWLAAPTHAQESAVPLPTPTTGDLSGGETPSNIVKLVSEAINGNGSAQTTLLHDYLASSLLVLASLIISYIIASAIGRSIGSFVSRRVDATLGKFLSKAIRNLIMVVVAMAVLQYNGIQVTGFAAVLAALSFAIGMALQGTLGNFAAGIMLLIFRPFKIDDYIVVADAKGTVEEIDLFTTRLNTPDNRHVIVPNGEIFGHKIENYSRNAIRRVDISVGTAYAADLKTTRSALERAASSVSDGTEGPDPVVYLSELGASSVDWQLRVWAHPKNYWEVREQLMVAAKTALDQAGVSIPFPQMDVHVVGKFLAKSA